MGEIEDEEFFIVFISAHRMASCSVWFHVRYGFMLGGNIYYICIEAHLWWASLLRCTVDVVSAKALSESGASVLSKALLMSAMLTTES